MATIEELEKKISQNKTRLKGFVKARATELNGEDITNIHSTYIQLGDSARQYHCEFMWKPKYIDKNWPVHVNLSIDEISEQSELALLKCTLWESKKMISCKPSLLKTSSNELKINTVISEKIKENTSIYISLSFIEHRPLFKIPL